MKNSVLYLSTVLCYCLLGMHTRAFATNLVTSTHPDTTPSPISQDALLADAEMAPDIPDEVQDIPTTLPSLPSFTRVATDAPPIDYMAEPEAEFETNLYFTLQECIEHGLRNNLGLAVERYNPPIEWEGIRRARSVFDPQLYGQIAWRGNNDPRPYEKVFITGDRKVVVGNQQTIRNTYEGRIAGRIITGAEYAIETGMSETRRNPHRGMLFHPLNETYTRARITVPLLKNFGIGVNTAPIRIARNNWRISRVQLEAAVEQLITQITEAYWQLYYVRENANATEYTLKLAQELLAINEAKVRVGMAAPLDITQARARIASEEGRLLLARNDVRNAEDRLRHIMNFDMEDLLRPRAFRPLEYRIIPLEKPQVVDFDYPEDIMIATALKNRQDLEVQRLRLLNAQQNLRMARNDLLPEVNFLASLGYTGQGERYHAAFDNKYSGRHPDWALGVEFAMPLFYNEPVAQHRIARYTQSQQEITIEQIKHLIAIDVRTALRNLRTHRKRIYATEEATRFSREQLQAEQEKFAVGHSTTFDILDFQGKLADALSDQIQALADWRIAVAHLYLTTGRALEENNIVIDEFYRHPEETDSFSLTEIIWPTQGRN